MIYVKRKTPKRLIQNSQKFQMMLRVDHVRSSNRLTVKYHQEILRRLIESASLQFRTVHVHRDIPRDRAEVNTADTWTTSSETQIAT